MKSSTKAIVAIIILLVLVLGFYFISKKISALTGKSILGWIISDLNIGKGELDDFAKCLTGEGRGILFIKGQNCEPCVKQLADFGNSAQYLNITDCSKTPEKCSTAGITKVPTWRFGKNVYVTYVGRQPLEKLADTTLCPINNSE